MKADIYNTSGKKSGSITLPAEVFDAPWRPDLVHDVVTAMQNNARTNVAHTKDRSEVRGGGKKPWRQKGTGRARHGSTRSPIWAGGGVTFGPRNERQFKQKINRKAKTRALLSVLSQKMRDGEILFVDAIDVKEKNTKNARGILSALSVVEGFSNLVAKKQNAALVATIARDENTYKSFSNFNNIAIDEVRNLNPVDLLRYKYVIIEKPEEALGFLKSKIEREKRAQEEVSPVKQKAKAQVS